MEMGFVHRRDMIGDVIRGPRQGVELTDKGIVR